MNSSFNGQGESYEQKSEPNEVLELSSSSSGSAAISQPVQTFAPGTLFAGIVVRATARAVNRPFTYYIPNELRDEVHLGSVVEIRFGLTNRVLAGFVVELTPYLPQFAAFKLKPISRVVVSTPFWGQELLDLAGFMRSYYACSWLDSLKVAIPAPVLGRVQIAIGKGQECRISLPERHYSHRKPSQESCTNVSAYPRLPLNPSQQAAVQAIAQARRSGKPVLLFGVTGSGKTEVYLHVVEEVLREQRTAIVLVPEVSLTPQAVKRYCGRLGQTVGVLHSALSDAQRRAYWLAMRQSQLQVALGTRSAVFAPLTELGVIIIDEEHESSYKQELTPNYHARQLGFLRAKANHCSIVLGSATPCVESFYLAQIGVYQLVELPQRAQGQRMPEIKLVDMRRAPRKHRLLSVELVEAIRQRLARSEQVVLLLNKRGYSSFVQCLSCGYVPECPDCSIALNYHKANGSLCCHYCHRREPWEKICPQCHKSSFDYGAPGTERLASTLREFFPEVTISRLDRDTTAAIGSHSEILQEFASGKSQILLGTRMVAKGLDYPNVTLVGVVNADSELFVPDFRASERCFQLLVQVSGRAGRGEKPGVVILQTRNPENQVLQAVAKHDYLAMYHHELEERREANYPPFCRLVRLGLASDDPVLAEQEAQRASEELALELPDSTVIGPAPCPVERIKRQYRWHILFKGKTVIPMVEAISRYIAQRPRLKVAFSVDPDPQSLT